MCFKTIDQMKTKLKNDSFFLSSCKFDAYSLEKVKI